MQLSSRCVCVSRALSTMQLLCCASAGCSEARPVTSDAWANPPPPATPAMALPLRRLRWKQSLLEHVLPVVGPVSDLAILDEGWSELVALSGDAKRKHIHWTHVRTHDPDHTEPSEMTRGQFWAHLQRVRKEVYPKPANKTGSILLFGGVAKEFHGLSAHGELLRNTITPRRTARSSTGGSASRKCP